MLDLTMPMFIYYRGTKTALEFRLLPEKHIWRDASDWVRW